MSKLINSNVEWIGLVPEHWNIKPISSYFKERNEKVSDYDWEALSVTKQGIVKQLDTAAKSDAHDSRKKVCKDDFVINSRSDRKQSCGLSPFNGSVSLINIVLEARNICPRFANYLLKNYGFAEEFYRYGSGIVADLWSTNYQKMKKIMIPVPDREEQLKIVTFLDEKVQDIDNAIKKTKDTIEDYKKLKQSIITSAVTHGIDKNTKRVSTRFPWLNEIPEHWKIVQLNKLAKNEKYSMVDGPFGSDMKNEEYVDEGIPIIQLTNIKPYKHLIEELKYITPEKHQQLKRHTILKGDIVIAKMMPAGRACIVDNKYDEYVVAADAIRFSPSESVNKEFILYCLNTYVMEECEIESKGTTRVRISLAIARKLHIALPPKEEQDRIVKYLNKQVNEIDRLIENKEKIVDELENYKKSVIYEYVTGKKEVK